MLKIEWTEDCLTGVDLIDDQHKHLIGLINQLATAIDMKKKDEDVGNSLIDIADQLNSYVETHFRDEENLYRQNNIDFAEHKKLHSEFVNRLNISRDSLIAGNSLTELLKVYRELLYWFMDHIKHSDKSLMWNVIR